MSSFAESTAASFDGVAADTLAASVGASHVLLFDEVPSTMDVAHRLAASGAPDGTLVLADQQSAGRGRAGRRWASAPGSGIWLTLVERPRDAAAVDVLSLRLGLHAAESLDRFADARVLLKWPNDLLIGARKLGGVLVEARWRDARPEWVAIGVGVNLVAPSDVADAVGLAVGATRLAVLRALVPALRTAAFCAGSLDDDELRRFAHRDVTLGRAVVEPIAGVVRGITAAGELRVETSGGGVRSVRHGSLRFASDREVS